MIDKLTLCDLPSIILILKPQNSCPVLLLDYYDFKFSLMTYVKNVRCSYIKISD